MSRKRRIIVLDASAFIAGFDPFAVDDDIYSVPAVGEELAKKSFSRLRFDAAVERGKLKAWEPSSHHLDLVEESSKETGDLLFLSEADKQILGLAMHLKENGYSPTIVTDDYSIQNVAKKIGVGFASLLTFGIRSYLHWVLYCPACRKEYPADYRFERCEICGTHLKRKPVSGRPLKKVAENQQESQENF